jgi:PAS domain S-box-containing protein
MITTLVLAASIAAQFTAAALALRLIRATGWWLAWGMIAVAMALMGARRSITFYRLVSGDLARPPDLSAELVALAISLLMVAGVILVAPRLWTARRGEGALRESEQRFRDFTDVASDWVWEMGADLRFSSVSEPVKKVAGLDPDEIVGKTRWELAGADPARDDFWRRHRADLEARKPFREFRYTYRDPGGGAHHMKISGTPVFDDRGAFTGYRGVARDETAAVEARARAVEAEAHLVEALDGISDGFALYDAEDRLVLRNDRYILAPEISPMAQPGTRFEAIIRAITDAGLFPDAVGREEEFIRERLDFHRDPRGVMEQRDSDNRWMQIAERRTRDGGTLILVTDITEPKRREQELRESEERYRAILDNMADTFYRTDAEGRLVMVSRSATELLGYSVDELIGHKLDDLYADPEGRDGFLRALQANDGKVRGHEAVLRRKDGGEIWVSTNARFRFGADGEVIGVEGTTRDITERKRAEQALRESEASLANAQRIARLGNWDWDIVNNELRWSDEIYRIFGLQPQEFGATYEAFLNSVHPDDREPVQGAVDRALHDKAPYTIDHRIVLPDGEERIVHEQGEVTFDDSGQPVRMTGAVHDVTEAKRAEAEIAARARQQMAVAELGQFALSGPDIKALADRTVALVAETLEVQYAKVLELRPDGESFLLFSGVGWKEGYVGRAEVKAGMDSQAGYTLASSEPVIVDDLDAETRFHVPALLFEHGVVSGLSVSIEGGARPLGVLGAHCTRRRAFSQDDVHFLQAVAHVLAEAIERGRAVEALRQSEARLQGILDHAPAIIYLKDREGRYLVVNREFEKIYGIEAGEIIGKTAHDIFEPAVSDAYLDTDRAVLGTGAPVEREVPDPFVGGERTLLVVKFPVVDGAGEVVAVGGVETDITEIKRIEQQLIQAQKMEAVGQLTGGVAHDFNNLLAVILGNLELLDERLEGDAASRDLAQRAVDAAERGATLTQRLLAFSRKQALRPETTDLNRLVPGVTQLLHRTLGETIEIETVLAGGLWHTLVDRAQLESALLNLALNARDAMAGNGKLTIETSNARLDEDYAAGHEEVTPGQYVMLAVSDTGEGMPAEVVERAFEPFFTTKEPGKGSGLGLSMVYGFAKQSGGHAKVYSEPGHGTLVKLYLPKAIAGAEERPEALPAEPDNLGRGETIMVVEDDAAVRQYAVALLTRLGYRTVAAEDGKSALAALERAPEVALLFCDVVLPGTLGGAELAAEAQRRRPGLKVLFTSGYTENAIVHHGRLDPGLDLIEKPYRMAPLARKLRAMIER